MTARKRPPRCARARLLPLIALTAGCFAAVPAVRAQETAASPMVDELQRMIQERDAVILDLLRRIERLERMTGAAPELPPAAAPVPVAVAPPLPDVASDAPAAGPEEEADAVAQQAPGTFEVDEDAAERALERTLVETGALLLPFGQIEVEPSLRFERTEDDAPIVVAQDGANFLGEQEVRRNELTGGLELRAGLPGDAQLEFDLPYYYVDRSVVITGGGFEAIERDDTGTGFGDLSVGFAKTLLRERGFWPDMIARVRWDTAIGEEDDDGVALGGGFNELSGQLIATKRQDPLVFVGSVSYETTFENDDIDPGDELSFLLGTVLAASPETSLRFFLQQSFNDEVEVDGSSIAGSDQVLSTLILGASSIVGPGVLLTLEAGVGVSEDAPDYSIRVGLPIRFGWPR